MTPDRTGKIDNCDPLFAAGRGGGEIFGFSLVADLGVLRRRGDLLIFSF
jgi:hypothetical protein